MGKIITFGLQKGGVSKSTTTGIMAHLLSQDKENYKVLAVDFDSQGNLTEFLTSQPANNFFDHSIFEAIAYKDPKKYIYKIDDNLDILPANNFLASYPKWIYTNIMPSTEKGQIKVKYDGVASNQLKLTLDMIKDDYDYIVIDTPPALSEQTTNALIASDYVVVLYEASKYCYSAVPNFMETVEHIQGSMDLEILGILRTLNDRRRKDVHFFNKLIKNDYPELIFDTVITRKASTGRLPLNGFVDNPELEDAISQFRGFYKEALERMEVVEANG